MTDWVYLVGQIENLNVVELVVKNIIEEKILRLVYRFWVSLNFRDNFWSKKNLRKLIGHNRERRDCRKYQVDKNHYVSSSVK